MSGKVGIFLQPALYYLSRYDYAIMSIYCYVI